MRPDVERRVSVMMAHDDCATDVRALSELLKKVQSGSVVWEVWKVGVRVEGLWLQRQNECARGMMARREYRHRESHLDETGCVDAGAALHLGAVFVSSRQDETRRVAAEGNVSENVYENETRNGSGSVHGLRTRLRHPIQQGTPRSSERVWPAMIKSISHQAAVDSPYMVVRVIVLVRSVVTMIMTMYG